MYWRSLWFRSPAADPSARGIFYLAVIATKKALRVNKLLTIAAEPKAEREPEKAQAMRAARLRVQSTRRTIGRPRISS
jgi:hypothetical protein